MKKLIIVACAAALALALAGCASSSSSSAAASSASGSASGSASASASSEAASSEASASSESGESVGMPNPWSEVESAEAAAEGAGVGSFEVAENLGLADFNLFDAKYLCMEDIAEVQLQGGAFDVTVRKSLHISGQELSGDYTDYPEFWVVDIDGVEVSCHGFEEGKAAAFEWCANDANYSVMFRGLGGENMAIDEEAIATVIANVK